ncbi:glutathione S-transferase, partial [Pseudomonas sp. MWU12-2534b]
MTRTAIQLYDFPLSGHSHRARLMLSLLGLEYETIPVKQIGRHTLN